MCTLHLFFQVFETTPVLFAATRDENLDRAWRGPELLAPLPKIYGPRDLSAGGTWLGVNEAGLLVGLANHHGTLTTVPSLCSRGLIVLEALRHANAEEARHFAEWVSPTCKSYTLLVADAHRAFVVDHNPEGTLTYRLMPGCHVITNARFRDPDDPKARRSLRRMEELAAKRALPSAEQLFAFLGDHETDSAEASPLCIHCEPSLRFGTSSASVVRIGASGRVEGFLFSPGAPCQTPFQDVTPAFAKLGTEGAGETADGVPSESFPLF
jgi:uncharacterized protein with NRDE domain